MATSTKRHKEQLVPRAHDATWADSTHLDMGRQLAAILSSAMDAILTVDRQHKVILFNAAAERMFGVSAKAVVGRSVWLWFPRTGRRSLWARLSEEAVTAGPRNGKPGPERLHARRANGEEFPAEMTVSQFGSREAPLWTITLRDITRRHQAESRVERLAAIVEHSDDAIFSRTLDGSVTSWNLAAERMFHYTAAEMIGQSSIVLEPPHRTGEFQRLVERVRRGGMVRQLTTQRLRKDGRLIHVSLTVSPIRDAAERLTGVSTIARDITPQVEVEREVLASSERERQRLSRELHDGLGQHLSGAAYLADSLREELVARNATESNAAERLTRLVEESIQLTRDIAHGLLPVPAEPDGLMTALGDLSTRVQSLFRIHCCFTCRKHVAVEDEPTATHLYRIAQEAVNNAIRHGKAGRIFITLSQRRRRLSLAVRDNGIGIGSEPRRRKGMGLSIMRYRAGLIHGTLLIRGRPKGGTEVLCSIDLRNTESVAEPSRRITHRTNSLREYQRTTHPHCNEAHRHRR